jgi:hypothetical protein
LSRKTAAAALTGINQTSRWLVHPTATIAKPMATPTTTKNLRRGVNHNQQPKERAGLSTVERSTNWILIESNKGTPREASVIPFDRGRATSHFKSSDHSFLVVYQNQPSELI